MLVIDPCCTFVVVTFHQLLDMEIDEFKNFERMVYLYIWNHLSLSFNLGI